jgi:hypothetical protein
VSGTPPLSYGCHWDISRLSAQLEATEYPKRPTKEKTPNQLKLESARPGVISNSHLFKSQQFRNHRSFLLGGHKTTEQTKVLSQSDVYSLLKPRSIRPIMPGPGLDYIGTSMLLSPHQEPGIAVAAPGAPAPPYAPAQAQMTQMDIETGSEKICRFCMEPGGAGSCGVYPHGILHYWRRNAGCRCSLHA